DSDETTGEAVIQFRVQEEGRPYFLLNGEIQSVTLDGSEVEAVETTDPEGLNELIAVDQVVAPGSSHELRLIYQMNSSEVSYRSGGIGFVTSMADISNGNFFESYGPANFED